MARTVGVGVSVTGGVTVSVKVAIGVCVFVGVEVSTMAGLLNGKLQLIMKMHRTKPFRKNHFECNIICVYTLPNNNRFDLGASSSGLTCYHPTIRSTRCLFAGDQLITQPADGEQ